MDAAAASALQALAYVRWVGKVHPAYKLDSPLLVIVTQEPVNPSPPEPFDISVFERGLPAKVRARDCIVAAGGTVDPLIPDGFLMQAGLSTEQIRLALHCDDVNFISRSGSMIPLMDNVRKVGGAEYVATAPVVPFLGAGVRGVAWDSWGNFWTAHPAFQSIPPIDIQIVPGPALFHGTGVCGLLFGDGTGVDEDIAPGAKGVLPLAQGIFVAGSPNQEGNHYAHVAAMVDPAGPYRAVFEARSWTMAVISGFPYYIQSRVIDDVTFQYDLLTCQSMGNTPGAIALEALGKNVISVGGVNHQNDDNSSNDFYGTDASTGPTIEGRVKPDLTHFYDSIYTTSIYDPPRYYTSSFGGTSSTAPITCGFAGLFFEMWSKGIFGNAPPNPPDMVFENRCHMATAKAFLINTASSYPLDQPNEENHQTQTPNDPSNDLTRFRQGWGLADAAKLYGLRNSFPLIVDETTLLTDNTNVPVVPSAFYEVDVGAHAFALKVTMVYTDPPGEVFATIARKNDLNLGVNSPSFVYYGGNHGLIDGNWSTPGGAPDEVNTVENVFVLHPEPGQWTITVSATLIAEDSHLETPATEACDTPDCDVDFALVVSVVQDCNSNDKPDDEDIRKGVSVDANDNAIPDECDRIAGDPSGIDKSRFISFVLGAPGTGESAIRVIFTLLHQVDPPYPNGNNLPIPFTLFQGWRQYVGPPVQYTESGSDPTTFMASKLQCTPYYQDWSTVGLLHVTGEAILPSSSYDVQNLAASCLGACPSNTPWPA
jgi:hypothetical protein